MSDSPARQPGRPDARPDKPQPPDARRSPHLLLAGLTGLLSAAAAIGVSQFVAAITGPSAAPVTAVGSAGIDLTPAPVKNFAISAFGSNDKTVLLIGILVVLALCATLIGVLALRRIGYGLAGLAVFALIGLAAALSRPGAGPGDVLPTLIGAGAAAVVLTLLARAAGPRPAPSPAARPAPASPPAGPAAPAPPAGPGAAWVPAEPPADMEAVLPTAAQQAGTVLAPADTDRRRFLITASAALATAGIGVWASRALGGSSAQVTRAQATLKFPAPAHPAPPLPAGSDLRIPGLSRFITPNATFYRVDTALILPQVPPEGWRLRIHGMVEREITLTYHDLLRLPLTENYTTLTCVSNPVAGPYIGNAKWLGASLASVLRRAGIRRGADQLLCTSADGFTSGTPVQAVMDGRDALLAVAMNGAPLPVEHGFPVRMVVPGLYGYVSATKWVTDIKVTTFAAEQAYWVPRGWSQQAPIKTESRIDVPADAASVRPGRTAVAGVAWAQRKGIDAVEVRVDGGPWRQARLAAAPGIDTWRQWVWEWDAGPGRHRIEARATDATGYTQTALTSPPEPNGATGYPAITVNVG